MHNHNSLLVKDLQEKHKIHITILPKTIPFILNSNNTLHIIIIMKMIVIVVMIDSNIKIYYYMLKLYIYSNLFIHKIIF